MPMRQNCRHYESRTYPNGDTVRKCDLDLAPDAPWRCPEQCSSFEYRMDAGWTYGSLVSPKSTDDPPGLDDGSAAAVLDAAEELLNSAGPQILAEVHAEQGRRRRRGLRGLFRRR
jgi:hypothetical protein